MPIIIEDLASIRCDNTFIGCCRNIATNFIYEDRAPKHQGIKTCDNCIEWGKDYLNRYVIIERK